MTGVVLDIATDIVALIVMAVALRRRYRLTAITRPLCAATIFGLFLCGRDFRRDEHLLDIFFTASMVGLLLFQFAATLKHRQGSDQRRTGFGTGLPAGGEGQ